MAKADKVATVAEITDRFRSSSAAVVTEYRGLTMAQLTELRRSLGKDTAYTVAKNTLVRRAAADARVEGLDELFVGPTAVAFISGEPVDAAKALRDFAKTHPLLVIKGGLLDGRAIEPGEVAKLADLESREVLLAKLAGAMLGTLTKAAVVLNALPSQVARLAAALQEKWAAEGGAEASADVTEAPAAEAPPAPAAEVADLAEVADVTPASATEVAGASVTEAGAAPVAEVPRVEADEVGQVTATQASAAPVAEAAIADPVEVHLVEADEVAPVADVIPVPVAEIAEALAPAAEVIPAPAADVIPAPAADVIPAPVADVIPAPAAEAPAAAEPGAAPEQN